MQVEQHPTIRVLVADDDDGDRATVKRAASRSGLSISLTEAFDVQTALGHCARQDFDCILVDYLMPGVDGLNGLSAIKERQPFAALIMVTGHGDEHIAAEAFRRGAEDYIRKSDISASSLRRMVRNATGRAALRRKVESQRDELQVFARMLVHDLKAPIRAVSQISQSVIEEIRAKNYDDLEEDCVFLEDACERMSALISTLYSYTTLDAEVEFGPVNLAAVIAAAEANLRDVIEASGAEITWDANLPQVQGNEPLLIQLAQNLMANAIKFCRDRSPRVTVTSAEAANGRAVISFRDNGIGVPSEYVERIFEPFERLHTASQFEGTGLGLAMCRKIVRRHAGRIWCESEPGVGSVFHLELDRSVAQRVA